jgi:hypothetical protein
MGNNNEEKKYYVAPGKSVCLPRGIAVAGEVISYKDLAAPVSKKDGSKFSDEEIKTAKKQSFKELVESKKEILTTDKPAKSKIIANQVVDMTSEKPGEGIKTGAQRK